MKAVMDVTPWYRQFWPWFIIALPATIVVASFGMLYLALANPVSLVKDNYYKEGLGINMQLAREDRVGQLGLAAHLTLDHLAGEIVVDLSASLDDWPQTLSLQFLHPTDSQLDRQLVVKAVGAQRYIATLEQTLSGRWYIDLSAEQPEPWRIRGEWLLSSDSEAIDQLHFVQQHNGPQDGEG